MAGAENMTRPHVFYYPIALSEVLHTATVRFQESKWKDAMLLEASA